MSNREFFQGDQRQGSYEFVDREGRSQSGYPPRSQGYGQGGYGSGYGGPPPAYGQQQNDPYMSDYQRQFGGGGQQRPQEYPNQGYEGHPQQAYGQQNPGYGQQNQGYGGPGGPQEGERGFLGAVGGAVAGGAGGHYAGGKMNHGVLGTVGGALGGAIAGSMLQDHFKHDKQDKHDQRHDQRHGGPPPQGHYQQSRQQNGGNFRGNFSGSSQDITLDRDHDLIARCGDGCGGYRLTSVNLNDCLTNEFGNFRWERNGNFAGSARNVRLADGGRVLEADLADGSGGWRHSYIHLDERITNDGGELRFVD